MIDSFEVLQTAAGSIRGVLRADGGREFRGIRYANAQRFCAPTDVVSYETEFDATSFGPICPQMPGSLEMMIGEQEKMDEDCFFLNVFAPSKTLPSAKPLPVLFWIHGGAFTNGSGSMPWYNGSSLASRGAIVVTINYRLGSFGFLGRSNLGILDMISALRWTQRNISSFGGNPDNVTIFGESAGGSAVVSLLACPEAQSLFSKAWSLSPSIGQLRDGISADRWEQSFLDAAEVSDIDNAKLLSVDSLLAAQSKVLTMPSTGFDMFSPTEGGAALDSNILQSASQNKKCLVVGTNKDENKLWSAFDPSLDNATQEHWEKFTQQTFGDLAGEARTNYEVVRPGESIKNLCSAVQTDIAFRQRAQSLAEDRTQSASPTWMYWFTWPTPAFGDILGCCHALDIPFVFDNLHQNGAEMFTGNSDNRTSVADEFAGQLLSFATNGKPNWPEFNLDKRETFVIDIECKVASDPEPSIRLLFTR